MTRFIFLTAFLIVAIGMALHVGVELPQFGQWLGTLPGDLIIRKGGVVLFAPFSSALIISAALSLLSYLLFKTRSQ
jgi:hypothetical protein